MPSLTFRIARAGAVLAVLLAIGGNSAHAQVSPGPLARAHAALGGQFDCLECHDQGKKGLDLRCLACHKEIAATLAARRGLHGKAQLGQCAKCHPDHAGEDFELIAWEEGSAERFDHSKTTFPLEAKHRSLKCRDCHNAKSSVSPIADLSPCTDRSRGYVGLETACAACHADPHQRVLGEACGSCHGQDAWKPASNFKHQDADYALTGKHSTTKCDACHKAARLSLPIGKNGERAPLWKPLAHGECSDCHEDPHRDKLGPACAKCHVTDDFKRVERDRFDHDRTRYQLRGKHVSLKCEQCHSEETAWGKKPRFEKCTDCHKDAHGGSDRLAGKPADCGACHSVAAFKPSTYTAAMHSDASYALTGKHLAIACGECHPKVKGAAAAALGPAAVMLRPKHDACTDCHSDAHKGQTSGGERGGTCESCHTSAGWKPARFTVADHERTRFALVGRHAKAQCAACHGPDRPGLPPVPPVAEIGSARVWLRIETL
ncbi:MAG: cytochrome c3 family protein, partial [Deltaproteobacteria bacterium]|nr:cytochrome c3 family protein [Deltaproteobacteria bacterium]